MRFYNTQHPFYCGIDLHARAMYVCILNQAGETLLHRNMKATPEALLKAIAPYRPDIVVAVECMFTWYWLADLCAEEDIPFVLGHALYMKAIHGGKAKNDKIDSQKIAVLLRGGMPQRIAVSDRCHCRRWSLCQLPFLSPVFPQCRVTRTLGGSESRSRRSLSTGRTRHLHGRRRRLQRHLEAYRDRNEKTDELSEASPVLQRLRVPVPSSETPRAPASSPYRIGAPIHFVSPPDQSSHQHEGS